MLKAAQASRLSTHYLSIQPRGAWGRFALTARSKTFRRFSFKIAALSSPSQPSASSTDRIRIKVRSGQAEAEIEAEAGRIREAIELIPEVVSRLPNQRMEPQRQEAVFREPA